MAEIYCCLTIHEGTLQLQFKFQFDILIRSIDINFAILTLLLITLPPLCLAQEYQS